MSKISAKISWNAPLACASEAKARGREREF
jgi:hypothetical protein